MTDWASLTQVPIGHFVGNFVGINQLPLPKGKAASPQHSSSCKGQTSAPIHVPGKRRDPQVKELSLQAGNNRHGCISVAGKVQGAEPQILISTCLNLRNKNKTGLQKLGLQSPWESQAKAE